MNTDEHRLRARVLSVFVCVHLWLIIALLCCAQTGSRPKIFQAGYPRAFFFRLAEGSVHQKLMTYEEWERTFGRLNGVMVKVLDEEIPGTTAASGVFLRRFKAAHPEQLALAHVNGRARDPYWNAQQFFAGHWLYTTGTRITGALPAETGESTVPVAKPQLFKDSFGAWHKVNPDVVICALGSNGKPDWFRCEQAQVTKVDREAGTLRLRRGQYGTRPLAFDANQAYVAAHVATGPWTYGEESHAIWLYNFSTDAPRDAKGRSTVDVLVDDLAPRFAKGGEFAEIDGVEFDSLFFAPRDEQVDTDGDGKPDGGVVHGINSFGIGVFEFARRLRERVGDNKLILCDGGWEADYQHRPARIMNGLESEGWPGQRDMEYEDWSGGMNRLLFWKANARQPDLDYINYGFGSKERMDIPLRAARLGIAATCLTGTAFTYRIPPPNADGKVLDWTQVYGMRPWQKGNRLSIEIFDELRMGAEQRSNWLGQPVGPARHLAMNAPDLLAGAGVRSWKSENAKLEAKGDSVRISARAAGSGNLKFTLPDVKTPASDLVVRYRIKADPLSRYPKELPRMAWVGYERAGGEPRQIMTWSNGQWFESEFYFRGLKGPAINLTFEFEGSDPVELAGLTMHAAPAAMVRQFEHGVVLANPGNKPYAFELAKLFPGKKLVRLKGSAGQDPKTNDGSAAGATVTVPATDALFLIKR